LASADVGSNVSCAFHNPARAGMRFGEMFLHGSQMRNPASNEMFQYPMGNMTICTPSIGLDL
jgi:hypothetical protein